MVRKGYKAFGARRAQLSVAAILIVALFSPAKALAQATAYGTDACGPSNLCGTGTDNTAFGSNALNDNTVGDDNAAAGWAALFNNTSGDYNTATGFAGLYSNISGNDNTATGFEALFNNTSGINNTATGSASLSNNTSGINNTATGTGSLMNNTIGGNNVASGIYALYSNISGSSNTATGFEALFDNTTGTNNTATGSGSLQNSTTGTENVASGNAALYSNTTGANNTATGFEALFSNTTGNNNIAVGDGAGGNLTTGSNNIDISNQGVADESNTIRIGTEGTQTATYIAGLNRSLLGLPVVVDPKTGLLGAFGLSSARYKRDIHNMGDASRGLMKLRPVTFRYKQDPAGTLEYGLIAEDVEQVYPELVIHGTDGRPEAIRYQVLPAMLLNELQRQAKTNQRQAEQIRVLTAQVDALKKKDAQIDALATRMNELEQQVRLAKPEHLVSAMPY